MDTPSPAAGARQPLAPSPPSGGPLIDRSSSCEPETPQHGAPVCNKPQQHPQHQRMYQQNHLPINQNANSQWVSTSCFIMSCLQIVIIIDGVIGVWTCWFYWRSSNEWKLWVFGLTVYDFCTLGLVSDLVFTSLELVHYLWHLYNSAIWLVVVIYRISIGKCEINRR